MKPIAVLVLGCVPLAILTVASIVELANVRPWTAPHSADGIPADGGPHGGDPQASALCARAAAELAAERPLASALDQADPLVLTPPAVLNRAVSAGSLKALGANWPQWLAVREMIDQFLDAQRPAVGYGGDDPRAVKAQLEAFLKPDASG